MANQDKTGSHFEFPEHTLDEQDLYLELPLRPREIKFLEAAFATRERVQSDIFTASELLEELKARELPTARATIDRYCRSLNELGVFDATFRKAGETRTVKRRLWRLRDLSDARKSIEPKIHVLAQKKSNPISRTRKIRESNSQYLKSLENATPRSENFWFGFLDRCMARNAWEEIPGNFMVNELPFKKERVTIETSTQTNGDRLLAWTDKPIMRAILSQIAGLIEQRIQSGATVDTLENAFPIDLVEIAKLIDLNQPHNTRNQERIYASIRALESTRFDVKVDDPQTSEFMEFFNLNQSDTKIRESHFRFIGHIDILDDMDSRSIPRHLVVSLGPHLWYRIRNNPTTQAIFRSHREMLTTKISGVMQVLYDYLRPVIYKAKGKPERTINRPLQHFAQTLVPSIEYADFKRKLVAGLLYHADEKYQDWDERSEEPLEVLFCGYYITLMKVTDLPANLKTKDNLVIQVQRDPYDPIIGDPGKKPSPVEKTGSKKSQLSFF